MGYWHWQPEDRPSIFEMTLTLVGIIFFCAFLVAMFMSQKYDPQYHEQPLVLKLLSLSVSNLSVSNSLLTASWDTNFMFANKNSTHEITIESCESLLYYNQRNALSCARVEPIHLGTKRQKLVQIKFNSTGCGGELPYIGDQLLAEIRKDVEKGTLHLKLRMNMRVLYERGSWGWYYDLKPDCGDLDVKFVSATGTGGLTNGPNACSASFPK